MNALTTKAIMFHSKAVTLPGRARKRMLEIKEDGQGTTEYAILVGVLAVIAIIAIVAFKDKVQELWTAIQKNIISIKVPTSTTKSS